MTEMWKEGQKVVFSKSLEHHRPALYEYILIFHVLAAKVKERSSVVLAGAGATLVDLAQSKL